MAALGRDERPSSVSSSLSCTLSLRPRDPRLARSRRAEHWAFMATLRICWPLTLSDLLFKAALALLQTLPCPGGLGSLYLFVQEHPISECDWVEGHLNTPPSSRAHTCHRRDFALECLSASWAHVVHTFCPSACLQVSSVTSREGRPPCCCAVCLCVPPTPTGRSLCWRWPLEETHITQNVTFSVSRAVSVRDGKSAVIPPLLRRPQGVPGLSS